MLRKFKFFNFRCYADEVEFDLTALPLKEHRDSLIENNGVNLLPVAAIYGANASGKSTFFMAMHRMNAIIIDRFLAQQRNADVKSRLLTVPFMFDRKLEESPTCFEVTILIGSYEYRYGFLCTKQSITKEYLFKKRISKNKTLEKMIFTREGKKLDAGKVNKKQLDEVNYCWSMASDKTLLLADIGMRHKDLEIESVFKWFLVSGTSWPIYDSTFSDSNFCERFVGDILHEYQDDVFRKQYTNFIHEVDPSIDDIVPIEETDSDGDKFYIARTVHKIKNEEYTVRLSSESEGTRKIMFVSFILFRALQNGYCLFLDELDAKIHPLVLQRIINMFTNKELNPKGAQLVFSAHNLVNFNSEDLRRDEIWLVEKNDHKSRIFPLSSSEESRVRSDLNFSKCYLAGRFGGVPFTEEK